MLSNLFNSILTTDVTTISVSHFVICIIVSLAIGVGLTILYGLKHKSSQGFLVTLAILPAIVCGVIMMVNGNIGAGVAVAGAFALVRFRSVPGSAKEIAVIFLAMACGLMTGMGYLGFAVLFAAILGLFFTVFSFISLSFGKGDDKEKLLKITIPEDLDYYNVFDDVFEKYTNHVHLISSKTTNMGSMYKLQYNVSMKNVADEKAFMDDLRCRNGNLEIAISGQEANLNEL